MKRRIASCPACAAPVEFKISTSLVAVCEFCHTIVARADKRVEDHGKVADLVDTGSPIHRGATGKFENKPFEVIGRVQYQHPAGGVWNEWYLQFPAERVGWLAEAQGQFYLMSKKRLPENVSLPDFDSLSVASPVALPGAEDLIVAEKGVATARSAEGTIPWAFVPNAQHRFADLHGTGQRFATIEYDAPSPQFFLGRRVSLAELLLTDSVWEAENKGQEAFAGSNTPALQLNCPQCGGQLTLHAPDLTQRVCCPNCKSLLDCQQGKLAYLQTLHMEFQQPLIRLGTVGKLFDIEYTLIGFMQRYSVYEGKKYQWSEYLLYNPAQGFRWLVRNQGHWSFVEPVPVSAVSRSDSSVRYNNQTFRIYDRGTAYVQCVLGEFYWRVSVEEQVQTEDYIAPPRMLSFERTTTEAGDELNVSLGTYLEREVLEKSFRLKELRVPWSVGAIQPQPDRSDIWMLWLGFGLLLLLLNLVFAGALQYPVSQFHFIVALVAVSVFPVGLLALRYQFEVNRWKDSDFSPYASGEEE